jgi:hypothetical protein
VSPAWPAEPAPAAPPGSAAGHDPARRRRRLGPADVDDLPAGRQAPGQPWIHHDDVPDRSLRPVPAGTLGEPHQSVAVR